ncbi:MAG TPA: glycine betaine ABC transporter substrate-binding protein [Gaiellaceae bacterium]|jgi:osmoprotectant transport system substrate-binding protein|nr:glycine betaine ABC transporter substrate-binding protein [Gaiellaceae bacterium]
MFRKHTRRAAKASFAISLAVALLIGLTACGSGGGSSSGSDVTVTIGTKNFTEQYVLGQLYKQALEAKGYTVRYKENIGSSELIDTALQSGKINFYPEYTGVIVADLAHQKAPESADATYDAAKEFEEGRGNTLLDKTPFYDSDSFGMLTTTAQKLGVETIDDMKKVKSFSFAGFPECRTRITCLLGLKQVYGLTQVEFVPLGSISVYTLLDQGKVTAGDVFSTDPQLQGGKYTVLTDTKHIFGFQNVAPVLTRDLADAGGSDLADAVNAVSAKLTLDAIRAMNKAVAIDKQSPAKVAAQFLEANGLS